CTHCQNTLLHHFLRYKVPTLEACQVHQDNRSLQNSAMQRSSYRPISMLPPIHPSSQVSGQHCKTPEVCPGRERTLLMHYPPDFSRPENRHTAERLTAWPLHQQP